MTREQEARVMRYYQANKRSGRIVYDKSAKVCANCIYYVPLRAAFTGREEFESNSGYGLCYQRDEKPVRCFRRGCAAYEKSEGR